MARVLRGAKALALLFCLVTIPAPLWASTIIYRTDAQLVALSERVVHGRVVGQRAARGGPQGQTIYTVTTIQIIEDLTGIAGSTVEVWELGGIIDGEFLYVGGAVEYRLGQEVLVCLERGPQGLRSVAMGFSKFDVLGTVNGDRALRRNLHETVVVGGAAAPTRERTLSEFRTLAVEVTGRQPRSGLSAAQDDPLPAVSEPFTLLGGSPGWRWIEADSGAPVTWYKNTSAPNPLVSGDAVNEIYTSLSAWTTPSSASIVLQYVGTTLQGVAKGPWTGLPSSSGVITFEDPNNEMSGSTLAIGGGSGYVGTGGTVNGTTFNGFTRGYVIFQNVADLGTEFRQSLGFTRVLQHEIGHAIGLGHTQTSGIPNATSNIMYPACCYADTPVPPTLGPDDLAGLNFIYPSAGTSCTFSINPTSASWSAAGGLGSASVITQPGCAWTASTNAAFLGLTSGLQGSGSGSVNYSVAANTVASARSGTLTIAGQSFTVNQAASPCTYALTPASASAPVAGGTGTVAVTATSGCSWTATSNASFLSITSSTSGTGNGSISYQASSNGASVRTGTLTIGGQTFTLTQLGSGPTVTLDKSSLRYGATLSGSLITSQTSAQVVRLAQSAGSAVSWTATSNQPWLTVNPSSGSGERDLSISVSPSGLAAPATVTGSITVTLTGAGNTVAPIAVTLALIPTGASAGAFGVVDTPADQATGVTGAVPFTGWALDDIEVANVFICRAPVTGEAAPFDPNCGGTAQIFVGAGVFIDGTRPDVQGIFPAYPRSGRAGWGFMVLTNMLPSQGNGVFVFRAYAVDREGRATHIGTRTMTCDNAHATMPFGTIDTPGQGDTVSGSSYVNFAWALTQQPKFIPQDGSTMTVFVDGVAIGSPSYNHYRSDIATLFPGLANSNGAVGFKVIDTSALSNGLHTIVWTATDSAGITSGLGSRFFRVSNTSGPVTASVSAPVASESVADLALDQTPLRVRRGWPADAPWRLYGSRTGRTIIRGEELDRFEIALADVGVPVRGYLRVGSELAALPIGSRMAEGTFTWSPGLGFVGVYDFVFVRGGGSSMAVRQEVRIVLYAKGSGRVGPQTVIDAPAPQREVTQPFLVGGWATDLSADQGTGVELIHVWAYPVTGGAPLFMGAATYGGVRPDVAAVHGEQFRESGYDLWVQSLPPGTYDVAVFPWNTAIADFGPAKLVRVAVK